MRPCRWKATDDLLGTPHADLVVAIAETREAIGWLSATINICRGDPALVARLRFEVRKAERFVARCWRVLKLQEAQAAA